MQDPQLPLITRMLEHMAVFAQAVEAVNGRFAYIHFRNRPPQRVFITSEDLSKGRAWGRMILTVTLAFPETGEVHLKFFSPVIRDFKGGEARLDWAIRELNRCLDTPNVRKIRFSL